MRRIGEAIAVGTTMAIAVGGVAAVKRRHRRRTVSTKPKCNRTTCKIM